MFIEVFNVWFVAVHVHVRGKHNVTCEKVNLMEAVRISKTKQNSSFESTPLGSDCGWFPPVLYSLLSYNKISA
jgi:hypothetical protein